MRQVPFHFLETFPAPQDPPRDPRIRDPPSKNGGPNGGPQTAPPRQPFRDLTARPCYDGDAKHRFAVSVTPGRLLNRRPPSRRKQAGPCELPHAVFGDWPGDPLPGRGKVRQTMPLRRDQTQPAGIAGTRRSFVSALRRRGPRAAPAGPAAPASKPFTICAACDRGHAYCSAPCRQAGRLRSLRAARARHQRSLEGRLDHRDRQRAYRQRRRVTDHTSAPLHGLRGTLPLPAARARIWPPAAPLRGLRHGDSLGQRGRVWLPPRAGGRRDCGNLTP